MVGTSWIEEIMVQVAFCNVFSKLRTEDQNMFFFRINTYGFRIYVKTSLQQ